MSELKSHIETEVGSEKGFGIVFAIIAALVAIYPLLNNGDIHTRWLMVAVLLLITAFFAPRLLSILNKLWFKFGLLLGAIITPLVMTVIYYVSVVPIGLLMKLSGKDILHLKINTKAESYWIKRDEPVRSMKDQF